MKFGFDRPCTAWAVQPGPSQQSKKAAATIFHARRRWLGNRFYFGISVLLGLGSTAVFQSCKGCTNSCGTLFQGSNLPTANPGRH